jgi:origin recognition complex subunit 2
VSYQESPGESSDVRKSARKSVINTPKSKKQKNEEINTRKSRSRKASEEKSPVISPKKLRRNRTPSSKALESIVTENSPSMQKFDSPTGSRHSERKRTPNSRLTIYNTESASRRKSKILNDTEDSIEVIEIDESLNESIDDKENLVKPTTLFDEEEDVEGRKLYSFKTPKKREGMAELANQTPKTPRHHIPDSTTPRTPKHMRISEIQKTPTSRPSAGKCTKTPRHVRDEIKRSNLISNNNLVYKLKF